MQPRIEICPFEPSMRAAVAGLLAESTEWLARLLPDNPSGFAAVRGTELLGYLLVPMVRDGRVRIKLHEHAARTDRRAVYRRLYAAVSAELQTSKHQIDLLAVDAVAVQTWIELGFGIDQIKGIRSLDPLRGIAASTSIRRANETDQESLVDLMIALSLFHSHPPMLNNDLLSEQKARELVCDDLAREGSALFVATAGSDVIGFMTSTPDGSIPGVVTIGAAMVDTARHGGGVGSALLARTLQWAREAGYERSAVGWTSSNMVSDSFWRSRGFQPFRYTMMRTVSPDG